MVQQNIQLTCLSININSANEFLIIYQLLFHVMPLMVSLLAPTAKWVVNRTLLIKLSTLYIEVGKTNDDLYLQSKIDIPTNRNNSTMSGI